MKKKKLSLGVSGIMRVKNDAEFISASIDSCIDALDELIIVYNDCTDASPHIIEEKRRQYPAKIKVFEYNYKIYSINLTEEEYEYANGLPDDSPHLLSNYYNFALSKVEYEYAMKIDADQIYFPNKLKLICDYCRNNDYSHSFNLVGYLFSVYYSLYRYCCVRFKCRFKLLPHWLVRLLWEPYQKYVKWLFKKGKTCLSLSGINVFNDGEWKVCMGQKNELINVLPPFNGENDHLLFKVSDEVYYKKSTMPYYNILVSSKYSLIEEFVHPYKISYMGFCWFHLNAMRTKCRNKVELVTQGSPFSLCELEDFVKMPFYKLEARTDKQMFSLYQRILFSLIFSGDSKEIILNRVMLESLLK